MPLLSEPAPLQTQRNLQLQPHLHGVDEFSSVAYNDCHLSDDATELPEGTEVLHVVSINPSRSVDSSAVS